MYFTEEAIKSQKAWLMLKQRQVWALIAFNRKGGISDEFGLEGRCALAAIISRFLSLL